MNFVKWMRSQCREPWSGDERKLIHISPDNYSPEVEQILNENHCRFHWFDELRLQWRGGAPLRNRLPFPIHSITIVCKKRGMVRGNISFNGVEPDGRVSEEFYLDENENLVKIA